MRKIDNYFVDNEDILKAGPWFLYIRENLDMWVKTPRYSDDGGYIFLVNPEGLYWRII
jgi:hypothetical protein